MSRMSPAQVVINVHGGLVQEVFASAQDLRVILVDWDQEGADPSQPELIELLQEGRHAVALVCDFPVQPLSALKGSDVEQAIDAARRRGALDEVKR